MVIDPSLTRLDDIIMNAHRNNVGGSDVQDVRREIFHDLLSPLGNGLNRPPHLEVIEYNHLAYSSFNSFRYSLSNFCTLGSMMNVQ